MRLLRIEGDQMNRRLWLCPPLVFGLLILVSCGEENGPTEPVSARPEQATAHSMAASSNTWTTKARMPTPRGFLAAGVANNSLGQPVLYAIGGFDPVVASRIRTVEAYNFATDRWTTKAPLPIALSSTNGVGNIGGKLYVSGGFFENPDGTGGWSRGLYVYDPVRNSWTRKADLPRKIAQGVTGVINGKLYVLAGSCDDCAVPSPRRLFRYDPTTDTWTTTLPSSPNVHVAGGGAVINGKFYVAGGRGRDGRDTDKLDVYDPVTNLWTTLAPMPPMTARSGVAGAALQNKLYILGQSNVDPGERQNQVEAYDPVTNRWKTRAPMPGVGRGDLAAGRVTFEGRSHILAVGGFNSETLEPGDLNEAYTP
jgi:N-acetylneuraminic acid mutarotase